MKLLKKKTIGFSAMTLVLLLSGCQSKDSGKEKTTTMAEILNGKEERKIVMTYDQGNGLSPTIQWAGTIKNGEVEIYPYSNYLHQQQTFDFNEIKDKNSQEYRKILNQKTKEYSKQKGKTLNIKPEKAKLYYRSNKKGDKAEEIILHYKAKAYSKKEKYLMANEEYSVIENKHPQNWLEIRTKDKSGKGWTQYHLFIEAKNGEKNLTKENLKEVTKKYNNVEVLK
ncbi:hypothetical protein U271_01841 [Staphylococcus aureus F70893]|uniref:hypothetical protein n=1 Tax=Staphylococcus aureus TaxID=1280 RepID=UPI00044A1842|nr:hypothetical protein [Staphylococcus aureus]EVX44279.1 hypothetical protein U271_01841 [Staphylococcus aureus F70893]EVX61484.1 hypothetical protein U280_02620 [Staphylococcus aureus F77047]EWW99095.1 hypothetical protein V308_02016 [Staphylococcus aureus H81433]MBG1130540.1 hypothetical protein [Staphylococcus aureus]